MTKIKRGVILIILLVCIGIYSLLNYKYFLPSRNPYSQENSVQNAINALTEDNSGETEWCLILINKQNPIPAEYKVELKQLTNGQAVDNRIYSALQKMFKAARKSGVYPIVASGYRTAADQQRLMDEKIAAYKAEGYSAKKAAAKAEAWVSIPGTSEHQLGIAVDINADGIHSTGNEVYEWLGNNAHKFGFIRRYPPGKSAITGISHEPWHYRYVGSTAAAEIYNQGLCLEEYLGK